MIKINKIDNFIAGKKYPPTPAQWQAIGITGTDVLVAAAAGSGKTEVLSDRISLKVTTDKQWDIDRMLVLTFTTAAAKNMLVRIENKIAERLLADNSEEARLRLSNQRMLMNDAYVSTIDSFCLKVLQKFYYLVEENIDGKVQFLTPNFSVLAKNKPLLLETIAEVIEYFAKNEQEVTDIMFESFGTKKDIVTMINNLYIKLLSIPNYEHYLDEKFLENISLALNNEERKILLEKFTLLNDDINDTTKLVVKDIVVRLKKFYNNKKNIPSFKDKFLRSNIADDKKNKLAYLFDELEQDKTNVELLEELTLIENNVDSESIFATINQLKQYEQDVLVENMLADLSSAIYKILKKVNNDFIAKKRKNNYLDFADLNHLAIKALSKVEDGKVVDTEASRYYKKHFLEIYVDEYQDNNDLQEYILNLIRGDNVNFFRVGDVKQSIYGFRGANSELFEEKYESYYKLNIEDYDVNKDYNIDIDSKGVCIVLKENFRSDKNVLASSNYIFNRLMKDKGAGISYDENSALYYPTVKENLEQETFVKPTYLIDSEINFFTGESDREADKKEIMIKNIAWEILSGVEKGNNYSDYAILVRNANNMDKYKKVFKEYNIPLYFKEKIGFTASHSFNIFYNVFKFLDNCTIDSSLLVLLRSDIFGYSNSQLLTLSLVDGKTLFEKLQNSNDEQDKKVVNILKKWLTFSLNNSLLDITYMISRDSDFVNYLKTIAVLDEEVDYYENFIDLVKENQQSNNNIRQFVRNLKLISDEEIYESKKRVPNNSVVLSTIHISKGLEYKYVFVSDLDSDFNKKGYQENVLFTEQFGLALDINFFADKLGITPLNNSAKTLYDVTSMFIKVREREEEIRNLYVALTRAEKGLFLVSSDSILINNEAEDKKSFWNRMLDSSNFKELITLVLENYDIQQVVANEKLAKFEKREIFEIAEKEQVVEDNVLNEQLEILVDELYSNNFSEQNNYEITSKKFFPAKTSYSALKKINSVDKGIKKEKGYLNRATLSKVTTLSTALFRGNVVHKLFERIVNDSRKNIEIENINNYLINITKVDDIYTNIKEQRILSEEEYNFLNTDSEKEKIIKFLNSDVFHFVKNAKNIETEVAFTSYEIAKDIYDDSESDDKIILQGVIDLLVEIDSNKYAIIDYKTDNVVEKNGRKNLISRHKEQLEIYKQAVQKYYKITDVDMYIYSYTLGELMKI